MVELQDRVLAPWGPSSFSAVVELVYFICKGKSQLPVPILSSCGTIKLHYRAIVRICHAEYLFWSWFNLDEVKNGQVRLRSIDKLRV